ncbi:unnamed protein product [Prorocentrum cordatum]|uniref:Uncharacterized protein n=1 Tax=Prorocentrum cordatum TaxID=2364126 RepID=A0ABN9WFH0_9DINO|nr:unnamed protein product [Polarella glacialis]
MNATCSSTPGLCDLGDVLSREGRRDLKGREGSELRCDHVLPAVPRLDLAEEAAVDITADQIHVPTVRLVPNLQPSRISWVFCMWVSVTFNSWPKTRLACRMFPGVSGFAITGCLWFAGPVHCRPSPLAFVRIPFARSAFGNVYKVLKLELRMRHSLRTPSCNLLGTVAPWACSTGPVTSCGNTITQILHGMACGKRSDPSEDAAEPTRVPAGGALGTAGGASSLPRRSSTSFSNSGFSWTVGAAVRGGSGDTGLEVVHSLPKGREFCLHAQDGRDRQLHVGQLVGACLQGTIDGPQDRGHVVTRELPHLGSLRWTPSATSFAKGPVGTVPPGVAPAAAAAAVSAIFG